jgi:WW domain-containing oxidoreductase
MSLYGWLQGTGPSGFGYNSTAEEVTEGLDLAGRTIAITGFNSGLGYETARILAERGATVFGMARSEEKSERTCRQLPGDTVPFVCDLSEPDSVRSCIEDLRKQDESLDALVANAGIMALPELNQKYGYELQFWVNHVGHFMLATNLVDELTDDGRAVILSSRAHERAPEGGIEFDNLSGERDYDAWTAYGQSKLANLLFVKELARRFEADDTHDKTAVAVHPGVINTNLTRYMNPLFRGVAALFEPLAMKSTEQGAATQTWAAVHPDAADLNGEYLVDCNVADPEDVADDRQLAERLWEETERIVEDVGGPRPDEHRASESAETASV